MEATQQRQAVVFVESAMIDKQTMAIAWSGLLVCLVVDQFEDTCLGRREFIPLSKLMLTQIGIDGQESM